MITVFVVMLIYRYGFGFSWTFSNAVAALTGIGLLLALMLEKTFGGSWIMLQLVLGFVTPALAHRVVYSTWAPDESEEEP